MAALPGPSGLSPRLRLASLLVLCVAVLSVPGVAADDCGRCDVYYVMKNYPAPSGPVTDWIPVCITSPAILKTAPICAPFADWNAAQQVILIEA